jgi:hypothetical protein
MKIMNRFRSYSLEAKVFMFFAPTFRWTDWVYTLVELDRVTVLRYLADVIFCIVVIEFVASRKKA